MTLKYVYCRSDYPTRISEQMKQISDYDYDEVIIESSNLSDHSQLFSLLSKLKKEDVVIVPDIRVLSLHLKRFSQFFETLGIKQVRFISIVDEIDSMTPLTFYSAVHFFAQLISEREHLGLYPKEKVVDNNKIGRPPINKQTITEIQRLYHVHDLTMRQIAELTEVALGTVYKYINFKHENSHN